MLNNKIKNLIFFLIAIIAISTGSYFLKGVQVKKIEIANDIEEGQPAEIKGDEAISSATSLNQNNLESKKIKAEKSTGVDEKTSADMQKKDSEKVPEKNTAKIINKLVDFGYQSSSGRKIDTIIVHSSYDALGDDPFSIPGIIKEYAEYGVSAHYLIGRDGTIYQLVADKNIAYHAGVSQVPDGRTGVNAFSLGIEMVNTKTDKFTTAQYSALDNLIGQLKNEYKIKYVLGHNQIAPDRKTDPWNFDWSKFK